MDIDLDDIFADGAVNNATKVRKFQPKKKALPPRKGPAATSVSSQQAAQTIDSAQTKSSEPVVTAKPSPQPLISGSDVVHNDDGGWHSFMGKSAGENAEIFIGLEDFLPQTTDRDCTVPPSEAVAHNVPNPENEGEGIASQVLSSVEPSTRTCKVADVPTYAEPLADADALTTGEPIVSSNDGCDHTFERGLTREGGDAVDSINLTELTTKSGQMHEEIHGASESTSFSLDPQSVRHEIDYAEQDSIPTFQQDDVLDLSSLGFTNTVPAEATSELNLNEEPVNLMEMSQLDSDINLEGSQEIPAKLTSRRANAGSHITQGASDLSQQQQMASTSSQNEFVRSLRPRKGKTNLCELVDEDDDEDEVHPTGDIYEEHPPSSAMEENTNNEELQVENGTQKKKVKRKSAKSNGSTEKPSKKRKKTEAPDQAAGAVRKRFSHSTRRRRVDKILLETPEDDIDYQKLPLRDLILLAEHRERLAKKEEAAGAPLANGSNGNSSGLYNEDENANQDEERVEDTTIYFNYQTYMDKTPTTRWSKQETELFYEAMRQFGTDLSMIQQLFPGRTRRQVKLKYKKEERQHPMRLREALTNRPKDNSHFEKVIERLKQIAAEENENAENDDLTDMGVDEVADEGISNADGEGAKDKHVEEEENEEPANESVEAQSPLKPDVVEDAEDEDDDLFRWSQYTSD